MTPAPHDLLTRLLKEVSRSWYLSLSVLPPSVRSQIGLAYLLARTTDTVADTEIVPLEQRLHLLDLLRRRILGESEAGLDFNELAKRQGSSAERELLLRSEESVRLLPHFSEMDRALIRKLLTTICSGQELDLRRFAGGSDKHVIALQTDAELEDYTYRVAGCVGEFWTSLCRAHVFPSAPLEEPLLIRRGVEFGKGLQLVNILRDLPADLRKGRCYLPSQELQKHSLTPSDLLRPESEAKLRPLYNSYLDRAEHWLDSGSAYTLSLPWRCVRVRLACAWPILIGRGTLDRLRSGVILDPNRTIKVARNEVYRIMAASLLLYPCPTLWRRLFRVTTPESGRPKA